MRDLGSQPHNFPQRRRHDALLSIFPTARLDVAATPIIRDQLFGKLATGSATKLSLRRHCQLT